MGAPTGLKKKYFVGLFFLEDIDPVRGFGKESAESKIARGGYPFSTISLRYKRPSTSSADNACIPTIFNPYREC
jgi:hypothetical protein